MKSKNCTKWVVTALVAGIGLAMPTGSLAQIVMTANDALNTSSFNAAGTWNNGLAPAAGSTYTTAGFLLRGPSSGAGPYVFAGDSLTVGGPLGSGATPFSPTTANNNALIFKVSGQTLTVNNLILDGGQIRDGNGNGNYTFLNGNIFVTANGGAFMAQDTNFINSAISGSSIIYIGNNGNGSAQRVIFFTSPSSTFNGNIWLTNTVGVANSRLAFAPGSIMNFSIGANGVNNHIFGNGTLELGGNFNFDLTGADNTLGNSWSIVDQVNSAVSYDGTFAVNGFTQNGLLWDDPIGNGNQFQYDMGTGFLSVVPIPEPSVLSLMGGLGLLGLVWRRRSKAIAK